MAFLTGTVGQDITAVTTNQTQALGQKAQAADGTYQYVKFPASAAIAQYAWVKIDDDYTAAEATTTLLPSTEPGKVGVAQTAVASSTSVQYGWVFVGPGSFTAKLAASCVRDVKLLTTATAGVADDAGGTLIQGAKLIATITTAQAAPCFAVCEMFTAGET